ncbi:MAG: hypothetical protein ACP5QG_02695 [candidate division WOR-3 bacterium]
MKNLRPDTLYKLALAALAVLPVPMMFFIFRERPFDEGVGFPYLRIGLAVVSFMIYMMARYMMGFLRMTKIPRFFPGILAGITVLLILVVGVFATAYGKWWAEYLPHGAIGLYATWRMKL